MTKHKIMVVGLIILILTQLLSIFVMIEEKHRITFYKNKTVEYRYLIEVLNQTEFSQNAIINKWRSSAHRIDNRVYVEEKDVLNAPFFIENSYDYKPKLSTDFYGYEFTFSKEGNLMRVNFYFP